MSAAASLAPFLDAPAARRDEPLSRHTSIRVGGPADLFCEVETEEALAALVRRARAAGTAVFVLGGGTDVVVADRGVRGLTIKLGRGFRRVAWLEEGGSVRVRAAAGANLMRLAREAVARGLAGLEFAEGIPGSVGGAAIMNAGAFGGELGRVVEALSGITADGQALRWPRASLRFEYRRLDLPRGFVVTSVELRLTPGDPREIEARAAAARRRRGRRQPVGQPNAGSIFKNPPGDRAGRLIELVGLKGVAVGAARVSPAHANFIVNTGGARAADVRALIELIRDRVWVRRGVWLEPEVRLVGEW